MAKCFLHSDLAWEIMNLCQEGRIVLVLSRKPGDSVIIDDSIEVMIIQIKDDKVRLGLVVPSNIPVHRKEINDAIHSGEVITDSQYDKELDIREFARELEASRKETQKYKTLFMQLVRSEWSSISATDLDEARHSDFRLEQMIEELHRSCGA